MENVFAAAREVVFGVIANTGIQIPAKDLMAVVISLGDNYDYPHNGLRRNTQWL